MMPPPAPRVYVDNRTIICGPYEGREQPYTVWRLEGAVWTVKRFTATETEARAVI